MDAALQRHDLPMRPVHFVLSDMRNIQSAVTLFVLIATCQVQASEISNKELLETCDNKTIVYGRDDHKKLVRVGEKIGGFCSGYLQATLSALLNSGSCKPHDGNPEYLFSLYREYIKEKRVPESESASKTLVQALRRVAECK